MIYQNEAIYTAVLSVTRMDCFAVKLLAMTALTRKRLSTTMSNENPITQTTPFEQIGGAARIQELVTRFYDLMEIEEKYADLRATHHENLVMTREKLFDFLNGWLGGPQLYVEKYGHPRLKARHMPFKIGVTERDQWVACMAQAMREIGVEETLFQKLLLSFYGTAEWMRNQPDAVEGEARMPNQVGVEITGVPNATTLKLQEIAQKYGVNI